MVEVDKTPSFLFSTRFVVTVMAFFGYCLQYMLKINMGIAIVCMVNNTALREASVSDNHSKIVVNTSVLDSKCKISSSHSSGLNGNFVWDKSIQGFILASYFYGYIITQIPGGWLSTKYGGKNVLGLSMLIASIFTIVTPFTARWGYIPLSVCRFIIGLAHGAFWPAQSSIFVFWAPIKERTIILGTSTSGAWIGNIIALPLGAYLCVSGFDGGWPSIFYIFGIVGCVWSILFMFIISDTPETNRFITESEKEYLINEAKKIGQAKNSKKISTPWKQIFLSKVCWATFIAHFCNNWGNYLYLTQLPSFMKDVLKFDIKSNGLMSAIPYVACALFTAVLGIVSDRLMSKNIISRKKLRKLFNGIGLAVPAAAVICLSFVDCSLPYLGVACLTVGLAFNGFYWAAGPLVNINDIGGKFSGLIFGITNTFGTLPGIICPFIVGFITKNRTQAEWQIVFIICACIYCVGALVYWIFCESEIQPWAVIKNDDDDDVNKKKENVF
ncbi:unnamed protein product [Brachionus calyciflorus]|uniref:Major facilitator superfamily (MFS) profile domain-containing protein n=1 Tax=Brachionus calyciflorus TaxID=104777 RepID=A0A813YII0_9BILA|nr:unnamed protein product [Brachionus calyciflorus]